MTNPIVLIMSLIGALGGPPRDTPALDTGLMPERFLRNNVAQATPLHDLNFYFENRRETLAVSLYADESDDSVAPTALAQLSHFVRCFRTDRERPIHARLAEIIARTAEAFGRQDIDVISGYRAKPYGAPHSKHFLGNAMDLHFPGVPSRKVAAWVWKNFRGIGVGVYPNQDFVHIDVREADVRWVDGARHGESNHATYFVRTPKESALPVEAPKLTYDLSRARHEAAARTAIASFAVAPEGIRAGY